MDYWKDIVDRGQQAIQDLCAAHTPEGQHLEFKRKSRPDQPGLAGDDKRALGESLSGMSNAEGGVILFGLADEKIDEVDCAQEPEPINNVDAVAGAIRGLIPNYLSPSNPDIEVCSVHCMEEGAGVVAIRVGASDFRPHMSLAKGHHRYYQRVDAVNLPMVDFQVRDMLRINTAPRLKVGYQLISNGRSGNQLSTQLVLTLQNDGQVSAKQPYIIIRPDTNLDFIGLAPPHFEQFPISYNQGRLVQGTNHLVIHPGIEVPVVKFMAHIKNTDEGIYYRLDASTRDFIRYDECWTVHIAVAVGAENTPAREVEFSLDQTALETMAKYLISEQMPFYGDEWY